MKWEYRILSYPDEYGPIFHIERRRTNPNFWDRFWNRHKWHLADYPGDVWPNGGLGPGFKTKREAKDWVERKLSKEADTVKVVVTYPHD